jgi:pimeloyl-ACP methyl ester carboxylesterase
MSSSPPGGDRVSALLYRPLSRRAGRPVPLLVMAHGLGAVRTMRLGGGHVIATAARLPGIAAAVAQCPFTDGLASARTLTNPLITARITARGVRDVIGARLGKPPVMVPTAGKPGEVALMNAPDAYTGYLKLVPDGLNLPNEVAARIGLKVITYHPGRLATKIACPILFCVCESDSVAPAATTLRYAAKAPRGEVKVYPEGHFAIYVEPAFERVVADQLAFLGRHLKPNRKS